MRCYLPVVIVCVAGCGSPEPTVPASKHLRFAGVPPLKWPGEPKAEVEPIPLKKYTAQYTDGTGKEFTHYTLTILEYPDEFADRLSPTKMLGDMAKSLTSTEVSRREIKMGARGYPGLDLRTKGREQVSRVVIVATGTRVYTVSVLADAEEKLTTPAAEAFFDSFTLE